MEGLEFLEFVLRENPVIRLDRTPNGYIRARMMWLGCCIEDVDESSIVAALEGVARQLQDEIGRGLLQEGES